MNKQEFILALTKKLKSDANQYYQNGIVDAIILAHKLDEQPIVHEPLPLGEQVINWIDLHCRYEMDRRNVLTLSTLILDGNKLHAVKFYKETTDISLKDAKDDLDIIFANLASVKQK